MAVFRAPFLPRILRSLGYVKKPIMHYSSMSAGILPKYLLSERLTFESFKLGHVHIVGKRL